MAMLQNFDVITINFNIDYTWVMISPKTEKNINKIGNKNSDSIIQSCKHERPNREGWPHVTAIYVGNKNCIT
jgi:hypothetical protein